MPNPKQKIIFYSLLLLLVCSYYFVPHATHAAGLVPCGGPSDDHPCGVIDIFVLIARCTNFLIGVAGLFAVYELVNHSFYLIISAGSEEAISRHRVALTNAVIGFVLVLMAYMLVNTVVNVLLTRNLVTGPSGTNGACVLNLGSPWTYLTIDPTQCSSTAH